MCLEHILNLALTNTHLPAAKGGLQQGGDAHTKENGANQLTGCPLVKSHTHGLSKQEGHSDSSTEAGKIVLRKNGVERKNISVFISGISLKENIKLETCTPAGPKAMCSVGQ